MKKMFLLSAALFVAATIFCGCSKDDDNNFSAADIVGVWNYTKCVGYESDLDGSNKDSYNEDYRGEDMGILFRNDGTGSLKDNGVWFDDFHYEVNGNKLLIEDIEDDDYYDIDEYTIEKLTTKELILYMYEEDDYVWAEHRYYERK